MIPLCSLVTSVHHAEMIQSFPLLASRAAKYPRPNPLQLREVSAGTTSHFAGLVAQSLQLLSILRYAGALLNARPFRPGPRVSGPGLDVNKDCFAIFEIKQFGRLADLVDRPARSAASAFDYSRREKVQRIAFIPGLTVAQVTVTNHSSQYLAFNDDATCVVFTSEMAGSRFGLEGSVTLFQ